MANMFALILVIATLVTGLLWCLDKFIFAPKRRERQAAAQAATGDTLDAKTLKKVGPKPGWLETGASVFPVLARHRRWSDWRSPTAAAISAIS